MLLTVKDLSAWLNVKPSTLYLWAAQRKIPCRKIHGVLRFEPDTINNWLQSFDTIPVKAMPHLIRHSNRGVDQLIEAAKRAVYTPDRERPDKDRA